MDHMEIQARATIAAALITSHAVAPPALPVSGSDPQVADERLRDLTEHVYRLISTPREGSDSTSPPRGE